MGLSPQQAKKILEVNSVNLAKKVVEGHLLTPKEAALLEAIAGAEGGEENNGESAGPEFAKNQTELANILGISRKTVQRYAKRQDSPTPRSDGRLCVAEWRAFLANHNVDVSGDHDLSVLKAQQVLLQNRILQQRIDLNDEVTVSVEDVERDIADLIATAKFVLLSGPASLAPQVVGVSIPEAETILREWLHGALSKLQEDPLGKSAAEKAEAQDV